MNVRIFSAMQKGPRAKQEDCLLAGTELFQADSFEKESCLETDTAVFAACDGLGGHEAGDLASRFVCEGIKTEHEANRFQTRPILRMLKNIQEASHRQLPANCGTTLAGLFVSPQRIQVFNAGDSRIYKIDENQARYISHDHSVVQGLLDKFLILQETAKNHPYKNLIEFGIGPLFVDAWEHHRVFVHTETWDPPLAFLLCTDGLSDQLSAEDIHRHLMPEPVKNGKSLLSAVTQKGLVDNTSFIIIELDQT